MWALRAFVLDQLASFVEPSDEIVAPHFTSLLEFKKSELSDEESARGSTGLGCRIHEELSSARRSAEESKEKSPSETKNGNGQSVFDSPVLQTR